MYIYVYCISRRGSLIGASTQIIFCSDLCFRVSARVRQDDSCSYYINNIIYITWLFYYYYFLFNPLPHRDGVFVMYLPTTNNGRTLWFSEHNSSIRENRFSRRTGSSCGNASEREKKMVTLTILLHPPEKSRVGRVRIIIKYYCQHHHRRRGKKKHCVVSVCVALYMSRVPSGLRIVNLKLKSVKKIFYYTTRASRPYYCS